MTISGETTTISVAWGLAIAGWLAHAQCQGLAPATLTTRRQHLERAARSIGVPDPWQVTGTTLVEWFARQPWRTETRRGHRSTLRIFYAWAHSLGHVEASPALALPRVKPAPPNPKPTPEGGYRVALLAAGRRDRVMLRLGAEVGMRRAEVAQAHSRDLLEDLAGWSILVHGKGGKERVVPLPDSLAFEIRQMEPGYLFPGADHGHLSPRWVGTLVARLLPEGYTMHSLRHLFGTRTYGVDRDLLTVQELLGHASPATTQAYVKVPDSRLRATVNAASSAA